MYSLFSGKTYPKEKWLAENANKCILYNVPESGIAGITAGQIKQFAIPSPAHNIKNFDWRDMLDDLSYGAFNIVFADKTELLAKTMAYGREICVKNRDNGLNNENVVIQNINEFFDNHVGTAKDVAQYATRFGLSDAPAKELGNIGNFAVYMGKFTDKTESLVEIMARGRETCIKNCDKGLNNENVVIIPEGNEFMDGLGFWAAEHAAMMFSKIARLQFKVNAVEGSAAQMRPYNCKCLASIVRRDAINEIRRHYGTGVVVLVRGKITEEQQNYFNMCFTKEKENSPYWGKTIILCDTNDNMNVDFYTDLNGLKMTFDLNRKSTCNVLGISSQHKSLKSGSSLSNQLLSSLSCADPEKTQEIVQKHAEKMIEDKIASIGFKKNDEGEWIHEIPEVHETVNIEAFMGESLDVSTVISQVCPTMITEHWFGTYKRVLEKTIEGLVTATNTVKFPTEGVYCKAVVDYSMIIAMHRVLGTTEDGCVECYAPAMKKAEIDKAIGVKFPKMGINEFAKFVSVTLEEIQERLAKLIDEGKITDETAEIIWRIYKNTSPGVIIIPAVEILKNLLAGMDFDGDAIQLYFNSDIVETLWKEKSVAVVIDPSNLEILG